MRLGAQWLPSNRPLLRRTLRPVAALVGDRMYESMARRAGADVVVIPEVMSGDDVADELLG